MARDLAVMVDRVVAGLERSGDGKLAVGDAPDDPRFDKPLGGLYWQVSSEPAGVVDRSRSLWDAELALPEDELAERASHTHRIRGPGGGELLAVERRVTLSPRLGGGAVRVTVAQDLSDLAAATRDFAGDLLPFLGVIALLLVAASAAQVVVGLAPLKAVRTRLAAIRAGTAERLGTAFPDEVHPLAAEVDALLDQREQQVAAARARAGDLAHGFKTPLQVLAGGVDRLRAKGESAIAADLAAIGEAMRRHVERELARVRQTTSTKAARTLVAPVADQVIAVVRRTPSGSRLGWSNAVPADLAARIVPEDLGRDSRQPPGERRPPRPRGDRGAGQRRGRGGGAGGGRRRAGHPRGAGGGGAEARRPPRPVRPRHRAWPRHRRRPRRGVGRRGDARPDPARRDDRGGAAAARGLIRFPADQAGELYSDRRKTLF